VRVITKLELPQVSVGSSCSEGIGVHVAVLCRFFRLARVSKMAPLCVGVVSQSFERGQSCLCNVNQQGNNGVVITSYSFTSVLFPDASDILGLRVRWERRRGWTQW
jgi:hypothetical protein